MDAISSISKNIFAFSNQAEYGKDMLDKLESFCLLNVLFYAEKWLSASAGVDAPYKDLQLWHNLNKYKKHDPRIANMAI